VGALSVRLVSRGERAPVVLEPEGHDPQVRVTCVVMPRRI